MRLAMVRARLSGEDGRRCVQVGTLPLAAKRNDDSIASQNRRGNKSERRRIAEMLGDQRLNESGIGREQHTQLISEAGEKAADLAR
jgi:hypothetical protein